MLKISPSRQVSQSAVTLQLEGRIVGPWVHELRAVCERHLREGWRLELDLQEVTFADGPGLAELARLQWLGVTLLRCSPFVEEQLKPR